MSPKLPPTVPLVGTEHPKIWILGGAAVAAPFIASPLPGSANIAALVIVACAVGAAIFRDPRKVSNLEGLLIIALLLWWAILLMNPNVIHIEGGILGYRLSMTFLLGCLLGIAWPTGRRGPLRFIWAVLLLSLASSIAIYFWFPEIEASVARAADQYTALFRGQTRLQGIFAGPFHVAIAASFLMVLAVNPRSILRGAFERILTLGVGSLALVLTQVRTGFVAVAVGLVAILLFKVRLPRTKLGAVSAAAVTVAMVFAAPSLLAALEQVPAFSSLTGATTDTRFTGRFDTWEKAIGMIGQSPVFGWGPGSAGATLQPLFPGGHVTPHNVVLNFGVEGGLFGAAAIALIFARFGLWAVRGRDYGGVMLPALVVLLVFGLTNSTLDAIPVTLALGILIGFGVQSSSLRANGLVAEGAPR